MANTRVYLVRHGATQLSAEDRFAGEIGVDLSDEGQRDPVQALAEARASRKLEEAAFRAPDFGGGYDVPPLLAYTGCLP